MWPDPKAVRISVAREWMTVLYISGASPFHKEAPLLLPPHPGSHLVLKNFMLYKSATILHY